MVKPQANTKKGEKGASNTNSHVKWQSVKETWSKTDKKEERVRRPGTSPRVLGAQGDPGFAGLLPGPHCPPSRTAPIPSAVKTKRHKSQVCKNADQFSTWD